MAYVMSVKDRETVFYATKRENSISEPTIVEVWQ